MSEIENMENIEMIAEELTDDQMSDVSGGVFRPLPEKEGFLVYQVQYRDALSRIARKYNTTVYRIMKANPKIKDANRIYTGQYIYIPMA